MPGIPVDRGKIHEALGEALKIRASEELHIPTIGEVILFATSGNGPTVNVGERTLWTAVSEIVGQGKIRGTFEDAHRRAERYAGIHGVYSAVVIGDTIHVPLAAQQMVETAELKISFENTQQDS